MLEHNSISRLGYFLVIAFLVASAVYMSYRIGAHEGDMRAIGIEMSFTKGQNEGYKEREQQYIEALQRYQIIFSSAYQLTKDATLMLKKGTYVIPPATERPNI